MVVTLGTLASMMLVVTLVWFIFLQWIRFRFVMVVVVMMMMAVVVMMLGLVVFSFLFTFFGNVFVVSVRTPVMVAMVVFGTINTPCTFFAQFTSRCVPPMAMTMVFGSQSLSVFLDVENNRSCGVRALSLLHFFFRMCRLLGKVKALSLCSHVNFQLRESNPSTAYLAPSSYLSLCGLIAPSFSDSLAFVPCTAISKYGT